jgi:hypothetical protein
MVIEAGSCNFCQLCLQHIGGFSALGVGLLGENILGYTPGWREAGSATCNCSTHGHLEMWVLARFELLLTTCLAFWFQIWHVKTLFH